MKRIVIIGSSGYIAKALSNKAMERGYEILLTSSSNNALLPLNLLHPEQFNFDSLKEDDTIIMLAAISSPDDCQSNKKHCWSINVTGTSSFINECLKRNMKVIFSSTDLVYGESSVALDEDSPVSPCGYYAKAKSTIENKFVAHKNFKSLRFSYVYSRSDKFTSYLQHCLDTGETTDIFHPLSRCLIDLNDLTDAILQLTLNWNEIPEPIINICGSQLLSRVDIATEFNRINDNNLTINIIEPPASFYIARPATINLKNDLLCNILGRDPKGITEMLLSWSKS